VSKQSPAVLVRYLYNAVLVYSTVLFTQQHPLYSSLLRMLLGEEYCAAWQASNRGPPVRTHKLPTCLGALLLCPQ